MSDDRPPQPERQSDERFKRALDEMFGPASSESGHVIKLPPEPLSRAEPVSVSPPVSSSPAGSHMFAPAHSEPARPKRSRRRTIALGCAGVFGLLFACLVALVVIGLVAGEDDGTAAFTEPLAVISFTPQPSYTADPDSGTSIER